MFVRTEKASKFNRAYRHLIETQAISFRSIVTRPGNGRGSIINNQGAKKGVPAMVPLITYKTMSS